MSYEILQELIKLNMKMTTYEDREIFFLDNRENYFYFKNLVIRPYRLILKSTGFTRGYI